jgi:hypothetical protein
VAFINAILFTLSIGAFCYILIHNALRRAAVIADAVKLPLLGCPTIHSGIEWLQWIPGICLFVSVDRLQLIQVFAAMIYELILFLFAVYKTTISITESIKFDRQLSLLHIILRDNILYFIRFVFSIMTVIHFQLPGQCQLSPHL